jgi:hypothetical protein
MRAPTTRADRVHGPTIGFRRLRWCRAGQGRLAQEQKRIKSDPTKGIVPMPPAKIKAADPLDGDRPIDTPQKDRLGFAEIAKHLADAFLRNDLSNGFVVGVEGSWGSGKSSLVKMALQHLKSQAGPPVVVEFQPWLVGARSELLTELFSVLSVEVAKNNPASGKSFKQVARKFATVASGFGALADLAGTAGLPVPPFIGKLLNNFGSASKDFAKESLFELKQTLSKNLEALPCPIIIFIDDLDRLDPAEAVEVLRLVRAVADFPNVGYILAYDPEVLAQNIERALEVTDGRAYIEKIVQASFRVPMPMQFDLLNWFREEAGKLLLGPFQSEDAQERFLTAANEWGSVFLKTPRDVVRALNALRLYAVPVAEKIDPADMVFLQLVRLKNPILCDWIEGYVGDLATIGDNGTLKPGGDHRAGVALLKAISDDPVDRAEILSALADHLPGVPNGLPIRQGDPFKVYQNINAIDREDLNHSKRLASGNHYRLYFALSEPAGTLSDGDLWALISQIQEDQAAGNARLRQLAVQPRPQGGTMGRVFLDRICLVQELPSEAVVPLLHGISEIMDIVAGDFSIFEWAFRMGATTRNPFGIVRFLPIETRKDAIVRFIQTSPSLAWVNGIVRSATFDHGYSGDRPTPLGERLLSEDEYEAIRMAYLNRLRQTPNEILLQTPQLQSLLYGWSQAGDADHVRAWVTEKTETDDGFVGILESMGGKNEPLQELSVRVDSNTLTTFFPSADEVTERLVQISGNVNDLSDRAQTLLQAIAAANRF